LEAKVSTVSQVHEVKQAAGQLAKEADALYVPIDKITISAMLEISKIFLNSGKFVVRAEDTMISKGAAGTYDIDYYELRKMTARQVAEILECKNKPQNMPVQYLTDTKLTINYEIIEKLGLKIPDKLRG
jgi:putative ABC transport system substrate-binding protein